MQREDVSIIVDDEYDRVQIRELLKSFGFKKIATAQNGIEAQVLLESEPVHIILADWHMSPVDGHELCFGSVRTENWRVRHLSWSRRRIPKPWWLRH